MKRYRMNKRKFFSSLLSVSIIVVLVVLTLLSLSGNLVSSAMDEPFAEQYIVKANDTLWSISIQLNDSNKDIRDVIHQIMMLNKLDTTVIHPGQILLIPSEVKLYAIRSNY
jgi:LysM repeat protein